MHVCKQSERQKLERLQERALRAIYNSKSITDGIVPALWKVARVTPLYKAEDNLLVENYSPIFVFPVLSKVSERVVHTQTSAYLDHLGLNIQTSVRL